MKVQREGRQIFLTLKHMPGAGKGGHTFGEYDPWPDKAVQ